MRSARYGKLSERFLESRCETRVRFQEVDSLRIVWHGHYLSYFELGRHHFGHEYGFTYQDILAAGLVAPLVHVELDFFRPAHFDQTLCITTRMHDDPAALVHFSYRITDTEGNRLTAGRTVQAFTDPEGVLVLTRPRFYDEFLQRWAARFGGE